MINLKNIDLQYLCNTLYIFLYKTRDFSNLQYLLNYFKDIASILNKLGISIPFHHKKRFT